jgi:carboxylesterase
VDSAPVLVGAEPFAHDGSGALGRIGVVVSHGFTGAPLSMRPWADHLAAAGFSVRLPRLPGHGTVWPDLNRTRWTDWYGEIRRAYLELVERCDVVFACGLSMGGTLVTRLAEEFADGATGVGGLVLVNASYGTMRRDARFARYVARVKPSIAGIGSDIKRVGQPELGYDRTPLKAVVSLQELWRTVVADLGRITAPVLYFHSAEDHVVDELSGRLLHAGAVNTVVTEVTLHNSYHVATMDYDAELIFERSVAFMTERAHAITGSRP